MTIVDTHFHPTDERFAADLNDVMTRARSAGVMETIAIGVDVPSSREALRFADCYDAYAAAGIHPYEAAHADEAQVQAIEACLAAPRCVALGEIGLDYTADGVSKTSQAWLFRRQLALAKARNMPVVLHIRDAYDDALSVLEEFPGLHAVLHCFAGDKDTAARALQLGAMISFTGMVTFSRNQALLQLAAEVPLDRLMVETDSPYLTPVPHRGHRNEPAYVVHTLAAIAAARGTDVHVMAEATTANAYAFFGLPKRRKETSCDE